MVMMWKFKWWSNESINPPATSDNSLNSFNPRLDILIILNFEYNSMEVVLNDQVIFTPNKIIKLCITYETKL